MSAQQINKLAEDTELAAIAQLARDGEKEREWLAALEVPPFEN